MFTDITRCVAARSTGNAGSAALDDQVKARAGDDAAARIAQVKRGGRGDGRGQGQNGKCCDYGGFHLVYSMLRFQWSNCCTIEDNSGIDQSLMSYGTEYRQCLGKSADLGLMRSAGKSGSVKLG